MLVQTIAGYDRDTYASHLANESVLKNILGKNRLASQPTLSRFINSLGSVTCCNLELLLKQMRGWAYQTRRPEKVIFDVDTTILHTYVKQDGGEYIVHYDAVGYHPIVCYDGLTGDLLKLELREGHQYCGKGAADFLHPILQEYHDLYPDVAIIVRGDSGFAMPDLYDCVESFGQGYCIRLKWNAVLHRKLQAVMDDVMNDSEHKPVYGEFMYQAGKWPVPLKVELREDEHHQRELFPYCTCIVTNMDDSPEDIIKLYCKRGVMEDYIKESKSSFGFEHMSNHNMTINENRLMISAIAYNIFQLFRRFCLPECWQKFQASKVRLYLLKIAGRSVWHAGKWSMNLCSSYAHKKEFIEIHRRIQSLAA